VSRPDVIVVTWDTVRADRVGASVGRPSATPNWDRLAEQGVRFSNARSPVPITLPAHVSLFTGLLPPAHGVRDNGRFPVKSELPLLAQEFGKAGYATGAFVSAQVLHKRYGLDRGFDVYDDFAPLAAADAFHPPARRADRTVSAALSWVGRVPERTPVFLWVHLFDPHRDWNAPPPWRDDFDPYRAEIAFADSQTALLLETLRSKGRLDDALVVLTSDHGEGLGEHGERTHAYFAYDSTLRVPLLFWASASPGAERESWQSWRVGETVAGAVSLVDLAPTIRELAGLPPIRSDGRSLVPLMRGEAVEARDLAVESAAPVYGFDTAPVFGVVTAEGETWFDLPRRERYDLRVDPDQTKNLYRNEDRERADALFARFPRHWPPEGQELALGAKERGELQALGYLQGDGSESSQIDPKDRVAVFEFQTRDYRVEDPRALLLELAALEASVGPLWSLRYREVLLLDALGRPRDALRALEEADRAFPGHWFLATELDRRQTEWGAREANLESARDRYREDPSLAHLEKLARALAEVQELERAEARYRELLAREPNDAMALLDLAEVSNASNEVAAARGFVDRVLALPAPGSRALCRAGRILAVQLADRAAGREALSRCARAGRSLDEVETLLLQAQARG